MDPTTVELIQRRAAEAAAARAAAATNSTSTRMPFGKEARGVNKSSKPSTYDLFSLFHLEGAPIETTTCVHEE